MFVSSTRQIVLFVHQDNQFRISFSINMTMKRMLHILYHACTTYLFGPPRIDFMDHNFRIRERLCVIGLCLVGKSWNILKNKSELLIKLLKIFFIK